MTINLEEILIPRINFRMGSLPLNTIYNGGVKAFVTLAEQTIRRINVAWYCENTISEVAEPILALFGEGQ